MLKTPPAFAKATADKPERSLPAGAASRRQVALLPCSRTESTLRASKGLRPFLRLCSGQDWTDPSERLRACFFEHSLSLMLVAFPGACMGSGHENIQQAHIDNLVFSQVMDYLPLHTFRRYVARYQGERYVKPFPCLDQYLVMAFAPLTYRESLRSIRRPIFFATSPTNRSLPVHCPR